MIRNFAVMALFAGAYASNPDEESFQRFVEAELKKDGSHWLERKIVAQVSKNLYQREDPGGEGDICWFIWELGALAASFLEEHSTIN